MRSVFGMKDREKRGFSIPIAMLGGFVVALTVSALTFFSKGELRSVKSLLDRTTGEFQAYSGLMWAYDKLCREGRWYQPAENSLKSRGNKWLNCWTGVPDGDTFSPEEIAEKRVQIYMDEVKSRFAKQFPKLTINAGNATPGLELLDHIKILALGTSGKDKTLLYGKLVMMPEPLLNSNSLVGMPEDNAGDPEPGEYIIRVPRIEKKATGNGVKAEPGYIWSQDIDLTERVKIRTVLVRPGQKVRMEDYVVTMNTEWSDRGSGDIGWATQEPKMRARFDGVVKEVLVKPGDIVTEGTDLAIIEKDPAQKAVKFPLIKLVRVTKITKSVFAGLDLSKMEDRYKVYEHLFEQNQKFLKNADLSLQPSEVTSFFAGLASETMSSKELSEFPAIETDTMSSKEKLNVMVKNLTYNFVPPFGFDYNQAIDFKGSATFVLGVQPREITKQLKELLEIHGKKHYGDPQYYLRQLDTLPKKKLREENKDLYTFKSDKPDGATQDYLSTMSQFNEGDPAQSLDQFVENLSKLKNGAAYASIYLNEATPLLPYRWKADVDSGIITDPENWFTWTNSKGEFGYWKYAPKDAIKIETIDVPYFYSNPTPIQPNKSTANEPGDYQGDRLFMKVGDLLNFHRKFFDEGAPSLPDNTLRPDDDIEDTPQGPPPPDATGCIFTGVSS